jgi:hypothetical protein
MSSIKAICDCKDNSEDELVVAIQLNRLDFSDGWAEGSGFWAVVLLIATGGFWIWFILGWNMSWILNPPYVCQFCGEEIENDHFR